MLFLAYLGGVLTILSPCILPIVPLVFSRADRSFAREIVPMLVGLAMVFAVVASVATASAAWIVRTSEVGRYAAIGILATNAGATSQLDRGKSLDEFAAEETSPSLPDEGLAPAFDGGGPWINSPPLNLASLRGKVVMVEFWTFACYNCLNALPHVKALEAKYRARGFAVVGVHTPEFPHEKVEANVRRQVKSLGIVYPVVMDNGYRIWNSFHNQYWPAAYFIDVKGHIRYHHFGEGKYEEQDRVVEKLLSEAGTP